MMLSPRFQIINLFLSDKSPNLRMHESITIQIVVSVPINYQAAKALDEYDVGARLGVEGTDICSKIY